MAFLKGRGNEERKIRKKERKKERTRKKKKERRKKKKNFRKYAVIEIEYFMYSGNEEKKRKRGSLKE